MSKARGRKQHHESSTAWSFRLPSDLCAKVDLLLLDPISGRVKYGSRTQLIETLLRQWLAAQIKAGPNAGGFEPDANRYAGNRGDETPPE